MANFGRGFGEGFSGGLRVGAASGISAMRDRAADRRQQAAMDHDRSMKFFDQNQQTLMHAYEFAATSGTDMIKSGVPREKVLQAISQIVTSANENAARLGQVFPDFDPSTFQNRGQMIMNVLANAPTPEEAATSAARAEAVGVGARVDALTPIVGEQAARMTAPGVAEAAALENERRGLDINQQRANIAARSAALQEAALRFEQQQPQSPAGRLVRDYLMFEEALPEGHPGLQALQETIISETRGDPPSLSDVSGLRKEFTKQSAETVAMSGHYRRLQAAARGGDAAGDMAMVFSFMKMLDPASTVREGEQASAEQARGVTESVLNLYNKTVRGERLTDDQRQRFLRQGALQLEAQLQAQKSVTQDFTRLAEQEKIDPKRVIWDVTLGTVPGATERDNKAAKAIGETPDGKKYFKRPDGSVFVQ